MSATVPNERNIKRTIAVVFRMIVGNFTANIAKNAESDIFTTAFLMIFIKR